MNHPQTLTGKAALITGAGQGLGRATALALAQSGASVVINDRNADAARKVATELGSLGVATLVDDRDISDYKSAGELVSDSVKRFPSLCILVNNAGITRDSMLHKLDEATWDEVIRINLKGTFNMGQAFAMALMKSKTPGRIINLSSVAEKGNIGQTNYAASKAGVIGLTRTWALELARHQISVNAIAPGLFETALTEKIPNEIREKFVQRIPLKRMGKPEEIGALARFLCSDEASYITGQCITIDGGLTTGW